MLVLRRKKAETIVLDGRIQIKVLRISHNTISLGIEAPVDVSIWRGELAQDDQGAACIASADTQWPVGADRGPNDQGAAPIASAGTPATRSLVQMA